MTWRDLEWLLLIIPLILVLGYYFFNLKNKMATLQFSSLEAVKKAPKTLRVYLQHLPILLKFVGILLFIIALARPQKADTKVKKNVEGIDIVIALDISDSMLIEDMKPLNRLESAKQVIKDFVAKRSSDRIGVVIFAGEAFTLVPPTLDYELLLNRISEITTAQSARIKEGTALGVGLANAVARLKESQAKTRVVIFMTDGENNSGTIDPETGLELAKGYGLKIYTIGIGRDGPTRIPVYTRDFMGNKIKSYQPFESTVNEELLKKMASETGGKFFRASKEDSLQGVFSSIDKLEKTKMDVN
ncbi:MAG: VWA domain-containing protein, partial [Bdellovibrionales bacterium]|nr:VWA domain-containing protein [Bdellovibrionales bacterium]